MSVREFVDCSVLVYLHDRSAGLKRRSAIDLMDRLWQTGTGCVSIQVLQEFFVVSTGKLGFPVAEATSQIERLGKWRIHTPRHADVVGAIALREEVKLSFWDAMIVRSAEQLGCEVLWTEDLNPGQRIGSVTIRNPFESEAAG